MSGEVFITLSFFASFFLCAAERSLIPGGRISEYCLECVHVCKVLEWYMVVVVVVVVVVVMGKLVVVS